MAFLKNIIDILLHLDKHLGALIQSCGLWTYPVLFLVVFCETGLVVTPFLPGDSLLFAAGSFAALGVLKAEWLFIILTAAAVLGDTVNYWIGHAVGPKVFHGESNRFLKKEYLDKTHAFYQKHGGKTIILARFIPIIRTFAPFVAGVGRMSYARFISFNVIGGIAWVALFVFGGYYFGNIPFVRRNFSLVIIMIIFISIIPGMVEVIRHKLKKQG